MLPKILAPEKKDLTQQESGSTVMDGSLTSRIGSTAFAFRGYNVTNLGKTPELLRHRQFGPLVEKRLDEASGICAAATGSKVNLRGRVQRRAKSTLKTYARDLAMIVAVELAQIDILREFFDVQYEDGQLAFGYSLGEITALVAGGVLDFEAALTPLLVLAKDAASLAHDVQMGVLFSRGPEIDGGAVDRLCLVISNEGHGSIAISSFLSPNTLLLLGQRKTIDRFKSVMHDVLPEPVHLRRNPHRWPPLHTSICRQKQIADRAWVLLETVPGGFTTAKPPVLSCVTGETSYDSHNARQHVSDWVDHPQRMWDVVDRVLASGVETVINVGPEPNIVPATFNRLSNNVQNQLSGRSLSSLGLRAVSRLARRRPWLSSLISSDATLLRAPFVKQIILEDWLLEQELD